MSTQQAGILHPGAMGASVGAAVRGASVLWSAQGRSAATVARAERAGLSDAGSLAELVARSNTILSVCPPHAALDIAREVAALGFAGTYVDCNAVSPARAREIASAVVAGGARLVDGGIMGPPAWREGTTRLALSGDGAAEIAALFEGGPLAATVIDGPVGAASALKMCYAAYTKGTTALLAAIMAVAEREGIGEALAREWQGSQPDLAASATRRVQGSTAKAWRFVGEMEEIAATFEEAGLPGGFHQAAAKVYVRLAEFKDREEPPPIEDVLAALGRQA